MAEVVRGVRRDDRTGHLHLVASGPDYILRGEPQILGQVLPARRLHHVTVAWDIRAPLEIFMIDRHD